MGVLAWLAPVILIAAVSGCTAHPPPNPEYVAQQRARQELNLLNARLVRAYQERDQAAHRVRATHDKLREPGLSTKERANYQLDLDEATAKLTDATHKVTELEAELRDDWKRYTSRYGASLSRSELCRPGSQATSVSGGPCPER